MLTKEDWMCSNFCSTPMLRQPLNRIVVYLCLLLILSGNAIAINGQSSESAEKIAYFGWIDESPIYQADGLVILDPADRSEHRISLNDRGAEPTQLDWLPGRDGVVITYVPEDSQYLQIVSMYLDGRVEAQSESIYEERNVFLNGGFSPNGYGLLYSQEALVSQLGPTYDLYLRADDGASTRLIASRPALAPMRAAWSPDSQSVVFVGVDRTVEMDSYTHASDLYRVHLETDEMDNLTRSPGLDYGAQWSPDGTEIAYVYEEEDRRLNAMILTLDDLSVRPITDSPYDTINVQWAFNGSHVVYVERDWRSDEPSDYRARLVLHDLASGEQTLLVEHAVILEYDLSPDGSQLAYISRETWRGTPARLCVIDLRQPDSRWCAENPPFEVSGVAWG